MVSARTNRHDAPLAPMTPLPAIPSFSIIVPIFNEIATARDALNTIVGKQVEGWTREVIIVESNSTDGTRKVVEEFATREGVRIIYEEKPRGKGHAVRAGLAAAAGDVIIIQDGDSEYDVNDYDKLLAPIKAGERSFVLGSRHGEGGWAIRKFSDQPFHALVLNLAHWSFTFLIDASLFIWLKDPFTMYKVFRRDCLSGITLTCNRFDLDWELLIKLIRAGHRPIEIPISYQSRSFKEGKKISIFRDPITWIIAWARSRFGPL